jgi:hypothetical protein
VSLKSSKEKRARLQFTSTDYASLVLTTLKIRWTIPLSDESYFLNNSDEALNAE